MVWRLWYGDGSTYSSEDGPPEIAPGWNLQVVGQPDRTAGTGNVGYLLLHGYDWYGWRLDTEEWIGVAGNTAVHDMILAREPIVGWCAGRLMPRERYQAIVAEAAAWAAEIGLPRKSGVGVIERRQ